MDWSSLTLGSASGVSVDAESALRSSTVWRCVDILSSAIGVLPLITYRRVEAGKLRATEHPVYRLLRLRPNPLMDAMTFRSTLTAHLLTWGNAYAEIVGDTAGRPLELWPIPPWRMEPRIRGRNIQYGYKQDGIVVGYLRPDDVLHLRGLSSDGLLGRSVMRAHAAESIGAALAAERFGSAFFGNGARPGGVLEHPGKLGEETAKNLREHWERMHGGLEAAQRVAILEEGMKYQAIGVPPEEAQFLETRQFSREEIANWFGVPVHMLNAQNRPTFASVEQTAIEFVSYTLLPWLTRWEMECSWKLFSDAERGEYFAEFMTAMLLRGDMKSRAESYRIALGRAGEQRWMLPSEVREAENLNPLPGIDDQPPPAAQAALPPPASQLDARAALLPAAEKAMARLIAREVKAVGRRAREGNGRFGELIAGLYAEEADLLLDALAPLAEAFTLWTGRPARADVLQSFAAAECESARKAALSAHAAGRLDPWLAERAGAHPGLALRFLGAIGG